MRVTTMLWLLLPACLALADPPATPSVSVDLSVSVPRRPDAGASPLPVAKLIIRNQGQTELRLPDPSNRMALAFLVMDDSGLPVQPQPLGKVDPGFQEFHLKSGESHVYESTGLRFLTGGAEYGYNLQRGQTYRIVAVYRPGAKGSAGECSREVIFKYE